MFNEVQKVQEVQFKGVQRTAEPPATNRQQKKTEVQRKTGGFKFGYEPPRLRATMMSMVDPYQFTGLTGTGIPAYRLGRGSSSGLGYTQVRGLPETGFTQVQVQV